MINPAELQKLHEIALEWQKEWQSTAALRIRNKIDLNLDGYAIAKLTEKNRLLEQEIISLKKEAQEANKLLLENQKHIAELIKSFKVLSTHLGGENSSDSVTSV